MTWALCLACGYTKFGAICPCPNCGVTSCGDMGVDIAFSDHRLSEASLSALGSVIQAIAPYSADPGERFWTFIEYISVNHPNILRVELKPEAAVRCREILAKATPPAVTLERSPRAELRDEDETR